MTVIYPSERFNLRKPGEPRKLEREEFFRAVDCVFDPRLRVELRDGIVYDSETGCPHRWTRDEYHAALECGILRDGDPIELLEGEMIFKMTQYRPHGVAVRRVGRSLEAAFGP